MKDPIDRKWFASAFNFKDLHKARYTILIATPEITGWEARALLSSWKFVTYYDSRGRYIKRESR